MPNLGYNTKHLASHTSLLSDIKENTKNIHVDVGNVNVNTDTLETKIQATNDKLDSFSGHTNNTIAMGDGSTQLRTVGLGYDRTNGKVVSNLIDAAGHQQIDLVSGGDITSKLDSLAGAGNNNIGEGSSKLQIYNYGRDVSAGNFKPMVVNSSAEQIVALSATDNAVLDNISAHTGTVDGCVASNKMNVNISSTSGGGLATEAKQDDIETSLTSIETDIEATNTKLGTIETDIEATNTLLTTIDGVLDNAELHLGNIETAVQLLDNAVDGNFLNVNLNLAGSDVANNSGNKSNTCPRVVIATDDVNISAIKATHDITTTTIHNNVSIAGSSTDTSSTVISFTHYPRSITIHAGDFSGSQSIAGNQVTISPLVSYDNSTYFDLSTFVSSGLPVHITSGDALTTKCVVIENARFPFMKIKLTNGTGSAQNFHSVITF